jgi:hypothetical protein
VANDLVQQALVFQSNRGKFGFLEKLDVPICQTGQSGFQPMCSAKICSTKLSTTKLDSLIFETRGSRISRTSDKSNETMTTNPDDRRTPLICYLENPTHIANRKVL